MLFKTEVFHSEYTLKVLNKISNWLYSGVIGKLHLNKMEQVYLFYSAPRYQQFPRLHKNGSLALVNWSQSFLLYSKLKEFTIISEGTVLFRGVSKSHGLERSSPDESKHCEGSEEKKLFVCIEV